MDGEIIPTQNMTGAQLTEDGEVVAGGTIEQKIAVSVTIVTLAVLGTFGNIITILAITTRRCMRTKSNHFILSLAISDLLSGAIASPLWLYRRTWGFNPWEWGDFACKLYWGMDEMTSYCTAMHIASFASWRFMLIKWPHRMAATRKRTIVIWISIIWLSSIIFGGIIYSRYFAVLEKTGANKVVSSWPMCSIDYRNDGVSKFITYFTFSSTTFLLSPMAVLLIVSVLITTELGLNGASKSLSRKIKEKKAVAQLALIASSFVIGYLPMTTYVTWTIRTSNKNKQVDRWFGLAAYICLRFSECMNPIAYNVASTKMRKASKDVLKYIFTCGGKCKSVANKGIFSSVDVSSAPGTKSSREMTSL